MVLSLIKSFYFTFVTLKLPFHLIQNVQNVCMTREWESERALRGSSCEALLWLKLVFLTPQSGSFITHSEWRKAFSRLLIFGKKHFSSCSSSNTAETKLCRQNFTRWIISESHSHRPHTKTTTKNNYHYQLCRNWLRIIGFPHHLNILRIVCALTYRAWNIHRT